MSDDRARMYQQHLPAVAALARRLATNEWEYDELMDTGRHALALSVCQFSDRFNQTVSERTWFYSSIRWEMLSFLRQQRKRRRPVSFHKATPVPAPSGRWEFLRDLGAEARTVFEIIIRAPAELACDLTPHRVRRHGQDAVRKFLIGIGWSEVKADAAITELAEAL